MMNYYAKRATEYEQIYEKPERQSDLHYISSFLSSAFDGCSVLEVACGTGYWTQFIAKTAKSILATDVNEEMLEIAMTKKYSHCRVNLVQSDAYSLEEVAGGYNAAFHGFWWSHVPLQRLAEFVVVFHSKLAEGSKVVLIDNMFLQESSTPISRWDNEGNSYQIRKLKNGTVHEVLKNFPSEDFLQKQLAGQSCNLKISFLNYYWIAEYEVNR